MRLDICARLRTDPLRVNSRRNPGVAGAFWIQRLTPDAARPFDMSVSPAHSSAAAKRASSAAGAEC
jgi:hypothetical protein